MTLAEVVRRWHGGGCLVGHSAQVGRSPPPPPPPKGKLYLPWKSLPQFKRKWWFLLDDDKPLLLEKMVKLVSKPTYKNGGQGLPGFI